MNKFIDTSTLRKNSIIINQVELEEVLEKRIKQGIKIEDLFLVCNSEGNEISLKIETKFGKLLCFCVNDTPKNLLLWHKKYRYPKIETVSSKMLKTKNGVVSHLIH